MNAEEERNRAYEKERKAAWFLAAFLSAGLAAFPAMAAQGWAQENNTWVYYDSNGNKVYNEWKRVQTVSGVI